jgi:hypothetical protein
VRAWSDKFSPLRSEDPECLAVAYPSFTRLQSEVLNVPLLCNVIPKLAPLTPAGTAGAQCPRGGRGEVRALGSIRDRPRHPFPLPDERLRWTLTCETARSEGGTGRAEVHETL